MATLQPTYWDLVTEVADFLGVRPNPGGEDWDLVKRIIEAGYRQFLYPPILPGQQEAHRWNFLQKTGTIDIIGTQERSIQAVSTSDNTFTVGGNLTYYLRPNLPLSVSGSTGNDGEYTVKARASEYDPNANEITVAVREDVTDSTPDGTLILTTDTYLLPADFGCLAGAPSFLDAPGQKLALRAISDTKMRALKARSYRTGRPEFFRIRSDPVIKAELQWWKLQLEPAPTGTWDLELPYYFDPGSIASVLSSGVGVFASDSYLIQSVDTGADEFVVNGDLTDRLGGDERFDIQNSTGNDGSYTVDTISYDSGTDKTTIKAEEDVTDATADGNVIVVAYSRFTDTDATFVSDDVEASERLVLVRRTGNPEMPPSAYEVAFVDSETRLTLNFSHTGGESTFEYEVIDVDVHPVGGSSHWETIVESCLSMAEQRVDDMASNFHTEAFMQRVLTSIRRDNLIQIPHSMPPSSRRPSGGEAGAQQTGQDLDVYYDGEKMK